MNNQNRIIELIKELDLLVSKEEARVKFASFGEVAMYATNNGYLRFGLELMKVPLTENPSEIYLDYLMDPESDIFIDHIETDEDWFDKIRT